MTLAPLTPKQVYEDQIKLKASVEQMREKEKESCKKVKEEKNKKKKTKESDKKNIQEKEEKEKKIEKMSIFARVSDVRKALVMNRTVLVLLYKEALISTNDLPDTLPPPILSLLQDF